MFGVGGGFLTTPLLIFYGIPPTVAAASAASQVTGASVSGVFAHLRRGGVDLRMGAVMVVGGVIGTVLFGGLIGAAVIGAGVGAVDFGVVLSKVVLPALISPVVAGVVALEDRVGEVLEDDRDLAVPRLQLLAGA